MRLGGNLLGNAPATCCRGSPQCLAELPCMRFCGELGTDCDQVSRGTKIGRGYVTRRATGVLLGGDASGHIQESLPASCELMCCP